MSVCSSGTSQPKSGVPAAVVIDQAYMQSILPQPWSFLYPYLPYMHVLEIGDVGAFCSLDPPTYTLPTAEDFLLFVTGGQIGGALTVRTFLTNLLKSYLWYNLCECSSGTPTAHPAADSDPGDLPAINPPAIVNLPPVSNCLYVDTGFITLPPTNPGAVAVIGGDTNLGGSSTAVLMPSGMTSYDMIIERQAFGAVHNSASGSQSFFADNVAGLGQLGGGNSVIVQTTGSQIQRVRNVVAGNARAWHVNLVTAGVAGVTDLFRLQVIGACNGDSLDGNQSPCCPPDTIATGYLERILTAVELIQRQAAPFGYVPGATTTGVIDNGSLTVADLLGMKIELTTIPDSYGRHQGDPVEYFGLGFVTWGTADGYRQSVRVEHELQVTLPPLAGVFTTFGYSLAPGVVANLTELVREP